MRGRLPRPIWHLTGVELESKLEALTTIEDVVVTVADSSTGKICDSDGATFKITFTHEHGDLPTLSVLDSTISGSLAYVTGSPSVTGTKTEQECCNRGRCIRTTGLCTCDDGFLSSDGTGTNVAGDNGDCGRTAGISACPGDAPCSGHGTCSGSPTYQCTCWNGFTGSDCSLRKCPEGKAWWDEASAPNTAHANAECSNRGFVSGPRASAHVWTGSRAGLANALPALRGIRCPAVAPASACPSSKRRLRARTTGSPPQRRMVQHRQQAHGTETRFTAACATKSGTHTCIPYQGTQVMTARYGPAYSVTTQRLDCLAPCKWTKSNELSVLLTAVILPLHFGSIQQTRFGTMQLPL